MFLNNTFKRDFQLKDDFQRENDGGRIRCREKKSFYFIFIKWKDKEKSSILVKMINKKLIKNCIVRQFLTSLSTNCQGEALIFYFKLF